MEDKLDERIAEVLDILNHTKKSITDLIPKKIINFLEENASKDFKVNIDYENQDWINNLPDETVEIMALIYRDYIVNPEERKRLVAEEQAEIKKIEEETKQKCSYDNLFKGNIGATNNTIMEKNNESQDLIIAPKKIVWYKKIINIIKSIFVRGD